MPHAIRSRRVAGAYWMSAPRATAARVDATTTALRARDASVAGDAPQYVAMCAEYAAVMTQKSTASARQ